jgi:hypothetical protein
VNEEVLTPIKYTDFMSTMTKAVEAYLVNESFGKLILVLIACLKTARHLYIYIANWLNDFTRENKE